MVAKRIFTVGKDLPGDEFEYIEFESDQSLLDADIVIFWPMFGRWSRGSGFGEVDTHRGEPVMDAKSSAVVPARLAHWKNEMAAAVNAGKLVLVYLEKPEEVYRDTGERQYSGTGRNARTTTIVGSITTYSAVPARLTPTPRSGTNIQLTSAGAIISTYWKGFGTVSPYVTTIEGEFGTALLQTPGVARTVGSMVRSAKGGTLLFLPPLAFDKEKFTRYDKKNPAQAFWNAEGMKFGKRLVAAIVGIAKALSAGVAVSPPPAWSADPEFATQEESDIQEEIDKVATKIKALANKRQELDAKLAAAAVLRHLLYEQGRPLENAILETLRLMGFLADGFTGGGSEFDAVFTSPEGRCLGEAEGKDTKQINIDKLSQLERNIQEDFAREGVTDYAKPVLFGNAFRLLPLSERGEYFTEKCIAGAKRAKVALVRTPDLFSIARYLKEHADPDFASKCRAAIVNAAGEVVQFPLPPSNDHPDRGSSATDGAVLSAKL
jgi:hypothetical protein